jgi:bifunctional enzyme CysN/CysC
MSSPAAAELDLLRFTIAGSVDDGKSTLLGRLLFDTSSILDDQLEQTTAASRKLGAAAIDLSLLTDGLRAEREQRITIDVAYRFFRTARRKFIVADTPGHTQYTRNMVTGASTADLAVILIDASKGVLSQSRRHAVITSLLGIPQIIVAVNKMDLVAYAQEAYDAIVRDFVGFAEKLTVPSIAFVPLSALDGDNVVTPSVRMPWYHGGPLLHLLENAFAGRRANHVDFRLPVQLVVRPDQQFRGYAGTIASGSIHAGEEIVILPSGRGTRIKSIHTGDGVVTDAGVGQAVVVTTTDEVDISRGDMIVRPGNLPTVASRIDAYLCWMDAEPLAVNRAYVMMHTTRQLQAFVTRIRYRLDVDTLHRQPAETLALNDIARVEITGGQPLAFDSYRTNMATGGFILIDPTSHATVAAGMIRGRADDASPRPKTPAAAEEWNVPRPAREHANRHRAAVVWLTGFSGAGKTTIAREVERLLFAAGCQTMLLDGDQLRRGLCADLGFSPQDRRENIRRAGEVAKLFFEQGCIVLCAFVSPYRQDRAEVRALFPPDRFAEVFVSTSLETCRARDPKQLYAGAATGRVAEFTGVSAPYEEPRSPELTIETERVSVAQAAESILDYLRSADVIER